MSDSLKSILNIGQMAQAAGLAGSNIGLAKKKNITSKDMLKQGVTNIVGTRLIGAQADIIGSL